MAETPASVGRRYLPFIAVAAVQVLLVAIAPSRGPGSASRQVASAGTATGAFAGTASTPEGAAVEGGGGPAGAAQAGAAGSTGATGGAGAGGALGGAAAGGNGKTNATPGAAPGSAAQDLSHCDAAGKEIGPPGFKGMPPCVPVWHGGENGGPTMPGVTADKINYVFYKAQGNAQVNAILATQGLAASAQQSCEALQAWDKVINKRYEHYGRTFVSLDGSGANKGSTQPQQNGCTFPYFQGQCQLTPPDPPCEQAEAKVIAAMKPAYVLAPVADPALYEELARQHITVVGGGEGPEPYYDQYAPYYWGLLMDGQRQAMLDAEYWCKKLNNKPAIFAGDDVKTARGWSTTPGQAPIRKLGIAFPETNGDPTFKISVDYFKELVTGKMCTTPGGVYEIPYASDINTAQQQSQNATQQEIQNHLTTIACWCDPIAPVFGTQNQSKQGYFPEEWMLGVGLIDYDVLGRLYDPTEWQHAFGVSDLALSKPFDQSDAALWWRDAGNAGLPDSTQNAIVPFFELMASGFQMAGSHPTAQLVADGLHNLPVSGGWGNGHDQTVIKVGFKAPSPWTAAEDVREVYWNASRTSEVDGKPGSYCPVDGGHRYDLGEWPAGDPHVFDQGRNGC
ncbi:MAG: hypothetical protein QOG64_2220 [Acidimicrobiaceae bacterium]|nr:hypothetical protein [Acidimicrobiaceae bacterium]